MKFSICIPNYNYEQFLGRTLQSVLDQQGFDLEILVSDNASTDGSLDVVRSFDDSRIKVHVNAVNVGFCANLDRAARMASGDYLIMLSSDDLMLPGALEAYQALLQSIPSEPGRTVISSTTTVISADDTPTGRQGPIAPLWTDSDRVPELDKLVGGPVYRVPGDELLRRCLRMLKNPFNFAATCYGRELYDAVEGYGGNRLINPDKAFHWKLLSVARDAYFVDRPLFAYRVHSSNQGSQEAAAGALKFMVDEYVATVELENKLLERLGMSRDEVVDAFVEYDVARHGMATLARGGRAKARRILDFGRAVYPDHLRRNRNAKALSTLLALGPIGQKLAERVYRSRRNGSQEAEPVLQ
jgi:glycosyltransferase involved in cell wall biosynthesis